MIKITCYKCVFTLALGVKPPNFPRACGPSTTCRHLPLVDFKPLNLILLATGDPGHSLCALGYVCALGCACRSVVANATGAGGLVDAMRGRGAKALSL